VQEALAKTESVGIDLETTGLNPRQDRVRLITLATPAGACIIDCFQVDPRPLFSLLADRRLVGHHLAFDLGFLGALGFEADAASDTYLLSQVLSAAGTRDPKGFHTLAAVAERELGMKLDKTEQKSDWSGRLSAAQYDYAARDAEVLLPLHDRLLERIGEAGLERAAEIEARCLPAVAWLRGGGVGFDGAAWETLAVEAGAVAARLEAALNAAAPMCVNL
jgi:ribonuclease D